MGEGTQCTMCGSALCLALLYLAQPQFVLGRGIG